MDTDVAASVIGPVAVATGAVVANKFGSYGRKGSLSAGAGTVADNAPVVPRPPCFIARCLVRCGAPADTSSLATVQINYPWIGHAVDASA